MKVHRVPISVQVLFAIQLLAVTFLLFLIFLAEDFVPFLWKLFGGELLLVLFAVVMIVSGLLLWKVRSSEMLKLQKKLLLLVAWSPILMVVSAIAHNLFSAVLMLVMGRDLSEPSQLVEEPVFFLLAVVVFPILYCVGVAGSVWVYIKQRRAP